MMPERERWIAGVIQLGETDGIIERPGPALRHEIADEHAVHQVPGHVAAEQDGRFARDALAAERGGEQQDRRQNGPAPARIFDRWRGHAGVRTARV
jgi:hypothetical protein